LSGEGAAAKGGRFNPAGIPALYLALSIEGMVLEMAHGFAHRFDPLTVCSYDADIDDLVDLRTQIGREAHGTDLESMGCAWFYDRVRGKIPASWTLARSLIARGAAGLLAPSFSRGARPEMVNLVLWRWGHDLPHRIAVHDPEHRLPRDQSSWQAPPG